MKALSTIKHMTDNELIAHFICESYRQSEKYGLLFKFHNAFGEFGEKAQSINFNSDWNLLMLVVDKIEKLGYRFIIGAKRGVITNDEGFYMSSEISDNATIDKVYNLIIAFIKRTHLLNF